MAPACILLECAGLHDPVEQLSEALAPAVASQAHIGHGFDLSSEARVAAVRKAAAHHGFRVGCQQLGPAGNDCGVLLVIPCVGRHATRLNIRAHDGHLHWE